MGKKAKEHRKKVANRNQRLKEQRTAIEKKYTLARLQYQKQIDEIMAKMKEKTGEPVENINETNNGTADSTIQEAEIVSVEGPIEKTMK